MLHARPSNSGAAKLENNMSKAGFMARCVAAFFALQAIVGLTTGAHAQGAGIAEIGGAAGAYFDYLKDIAPGAVEPLLTYKNEAAACTEQGPPKSYAVLIGAGQAADPFRPLDGPANDARLLATALGTRGVSASDAALLVDGKATRKEVAAAFAQTLAKLRCKDRLLVYFAGNSARPYDLLETLITPSLRKSNANLSTAEIAESLPYIEGEPNRTAAKAIAEALKAELYLALDNAKPGVVEIMRASDLSDFAVAARNRMVDVTIILDTSFAASAKLNETQERAKEGLVWRMETGSEAPLSTTAQLALLPNSGGFATFYSSVGDSHAQELAFPNAAGGTTVHGRFTFRLANAIQNRDSVTVRALAESLRTQSDEEAGQRYLVEASNPEIVLFEGSTKVIPQVDPITILKPVPTRGAAAVEKAEIDIEGAINWFSPARVVLVDGRIATLKADGRFSHTIKLAAGLNTVEVIALTSDGRTHEKRLEFVFDGDKKALEGEGARYAVVIAVQDYTAQTGFNRLNTPLADADALAKTLAEKFGFRIEAKLPDGTMMPLVLKNAKLLDIQSVLFSMSQIAGVNDTVLIYFAGHGIYEQATTTAFWVPLDAKSGVPYSYLNGDDITRAIQRLQANSVILISDSCFSGVLVRGASEPAQQIAEDERTRALLRLAKRRSRILISSGGNEPVVDEGGGGHSVFARALLDGLTEMEYDAFSTRELFDRFILPRVTARADQEPQYRPLEKSGHEGGDVVLLRSGG